MFSSPFSPLPTVTHFVLEHDFTSTPVLYVTRKSLNPLTSFVSNFIFSILSTAYDVVLLILVDTKSEHWRDILKL